MKVSKMFPHWTRKLLKDAGRPMSNFVQQVGQLKPGESLSYFHGGCDQYRTGKCKLQDNLSHFAANYGGKFDTHHSDKNVLHVRRHYQ